MHRSVVVPARFSPLASTSRRTGASSVYTNIRLLRVIAVPSPCSVFSIAFTAFGLG